ncbi:MAG TPA: hypothetical protein VGM50_04060 [Gemmatimonadaceae bacterium]|jgi:hypothetical protein
MSASDLTAKPEPLRFGTIIIVSGGCYGSYYHRQLQRAARAGAIVVDKLLVVDHDPNCAVAALIVAPPEPAPIPTELRVVDCHVFMREYLTDAALHPEGVSHDAIVPSPLMPHLIGEWIVNRARERSGDAVTTRPFDRVPTVPWERAGDDGTHYVSFATWMCPINCIEPRICPHTKGERTWTMPAALDTYARQMEDAGAPIEIAVLQCTHRAYGVGMIDTADVVAADARIRDTALRGGGEVVIGTVSHCHGALTRLLLGPGATTAVPR